MITCPRCQHQNSDTSDKCALCGTHLAPASRPHKPEAEHFDVDWNLGDSPDLFGLADEKPVSRRTTGSLPGLQGARPRATPPPVPPAPQQQHAPQPPRAQAAATSNPAGLAKLLQDALSPASTAAQDVSRSAEAARSRPVAAASTAPGARRITSPTPRSAPPTPAEDRLSDFLLDALSQEDAPPEPKRRTTTEQAAPAVSAIPPAKQSQAGAALLRSGALLHPKSGAVTCASCGGANPEGMYYCVHCGSSLIENIAQPAPTGEIECAACSAPNPAENRFCGTCGYPLANNSEAPTNWQDAIASSSGSQARHGAAFTVKLISINEDGSDGVAIPLDYKKTVIGRSGDTRFPTDAFLSPKHASLLIERDGVYIEDLYSLNGTFVKLRDEVTLSPGDIFLMGRQVLRFERFEQNITPKARSSDGTRYMGSPPPGGRFKLLQIGIGGVVQNVYCIPENGAVLGREQGEIIFPRDKFMSSRHAQLYPREEGRFCLVDLNSSNGTWIKIWEKTRIQNDDYIFLGQQLFRVELHT